MTKCCQTNTCVEIVPSGCVRYTGAIAPTGLIVKQEYCDPYLNQIIELFDTTLSDLDTRVGLNKTQFDNINNACGLTPVINTSSLTVKNEKYYSSEVVQSLVGVICELRSRLNYLTSESINVNEGNLHWEDLKLGTELKSLAVCLADDRCENNDILTLGKLLEQLIRKVCACCP